MKHPLTYWLLATVLCVLGNLHATGQDASAKPNIVIIFTDDQGYGDLSCFGGTKYTTPRLDKLATEGTQFTSFYAQHVCGPSRSALLTGRYPIRSKGWSMLSSEITWAELMQDVGYQTVCIGKWDVSNRQEDTERMPLGQGFDIYFGTLGGNDDGVVNLYEGNEKVENTPDQGKLTKLYTDKAIEFLEKKRDPNKPFVLYLAHTMMHMNIDTTEAFVGKSGKGLYGDVLAEFDYETGRLLDKLDELKLRDNTIVIYTTDNGPWNQARYIDRKKNNPKYKMWKKKHARFNNDDIFWGESGPLRGGKGSMYEGGCRVPLIIRWPGRVPEGKTSNAIFATIDFLPTFANLCGFQVPKDRIIDGVDQTDLILGENPSGNRNTFYYVQAMRKGKWKYVDGRARHLYAYAKPVPLIKKDQLFDLENDLGETTDLAEKHPEIVAELKAMMNKIGEDYIGEGHDDSFLRATKVILEETDADYNK